MDFNNIDMTNYEMEKLGHYIETLLGIKMPQQKKLLLQSRLNKRLKELKLKNFNSYYDYLNTDNGKTSEYSIFVDLVSTHVTYFFREPKHFEYLYNEVIPEICRENKTVSIWSAASSSGEEAYSIAITMNEFKENFPEQLKDFQIIGTDISQAVIDKAARAIYNEDALQKVPDDFKKKYFMISKDKSNKKIRVIPELRGKVKFKINNLMDNNYHFEKNFDIIFIRNVLIYFSRDIQKEITIKLLRFLKQGGFLFLGHSETLIGMDINLKSYIPSIFRKV